MMTLLRPRVGKEEIDGVEARIRQHMLDDIDGIMIDHPYVRKSCSFDHDQSMAYTRLVHFDAEVVDVGEICRAGNQGLTVAKADVENAWRGAAEDLI